MQIHGIRTDTGTVATTIVFRNGRVHVEKGIAPDVDV
jgi:hypothetical protein